MTTALTALLFLVAAPSATTPSADGHAEALGRVRASMVQLTAAASYDQFLDDLSRVLDRGNIPVVVVDRGRRAQHLEVANGIVFDGRGHAVTTASFAAEADEFRAVLSDGTEATASLIGIDLISDIAVLRLDRVTPPAATFAGDPSAFALGGKLCIVSGSPGERCAQAQGHLREMRLNPGIGRQHDYLLLDVPTARGSSGSAVVNSEGTVVGMVSARHGATGTLAVPATTILKVATVLLDSGTVRRAWLGVSCAAVPMGNAGGAPVFGVEPDGPAMAAGIRPGDVIVGFAGHPIRDGGELHRLVADSQPNSRVEVRIERARRAISVMAEVRERPDSGPVTLRIYETYLGAWTAAGKTAELPIQNGLIVHGLIAGSPAERSGLRVGDVIVAVDGAPLTTASELRQVVVSRRAGDVLSLQVRRDRSFEVLRAELAGRAREVRLTDRQVQLDPEELDPTKRPRTTPIGMPIGPSGKTVRSVLPRNRRQ